MTRWRRGAFLPEIAHLPDPTAPVIPGSRFRRRRALCERQLRADSPADADTLRCPDCAMLDDRGGGDSGLAAGGPTASAR